MKRILFLAALVALTASAGTADAQPAPATPAPTGPVITTGSPIIEYAPAQSSGRRGLFGRLRGRNSGGTMTYSPTTPITTAPITTNPATTTTTPPTTAPAPSAPTPMPMPGTAGGTGTTSAAPMPLPGGIVQASGSLPAGTYTTTDGTIIQIGGTEPAMESSMSQSSQSGRRGLFGRRR